MAKLVRRLWLCWASFLYRMHCRGCPFCKIAVQDSQRCIEGLDALFTVEAARKLL